MTKLKKAEFIPGIILETTEEAVFFEKDFAYHQDKKIVVPSGTTLQIVSRDKLYTEVIHFTITANNKIYADHFKNLQGCKVLNPEVIPQTTDKELDNEKEKKAIRKLNKTIQGNDNPNLFEAFLNDFPNYLKDKNNQKRFFIKCIQTKGSQCIHYGIAKGWFKDINLDKSLSVYGYRQFDSNLYFSLEEKSFEAAKFFLDRGASLDDVCSGKPIRYWLTWEHCQIDSNLVSQILSYEEKLKLEKEIKEETNPKTQYKL